MKNLHFLYTFYRQSCQLYTCSATATAAAAASGGLRRRRCSSCLYHSMVPFWFRNLMPPKTPPTQRKRKRSDSVQAESSNLSKRILRAMHTIGVPETEARVRYARLVMCCHAMRGVCRRWQAAWALHYIIKDWLSCPSEEPASEEFLRIIETMEEELAKLCYSEV